MTDTPTRSMALNGPAANRTDDAEIQGINDFSLVTLSHEPDRLIAMVKAPESPGEVDEYFNCVDYLDRIGFA